MLAICCAKGKNKLCCIIICYCEIKLKNEKRYINILRIDVHVK